MVGRFGTVLVDGFIAATWRTTRKDGTVTLRVESVVPLSKRDKDAVAAEGERLLAFTEPEASHLVSVVQATKSTAGPARTRTRAIRTGVTLGRARKKEA